LTNKPESRTNSSPLEEVSISTGSRGRPPKDFEQLSDRSKRLRTEELRSSVSPTELYHAASSSLFAEGKRAAGSLVAEATRYSPKRPVKLRRIIRQAQNTKTPIRYTPEEALASLIVEKGLSKKGYIDLRKELKQRNTSILPSYHKLLEAKTKCYPQRIQVNEYGNLS